MTDEDKDFISMVLLPFGFFATCLVLALVFNGGC